MSKEAVREFWDKASCGEELYLSGAEQAAYVAQARGRYEIEPYIPQFAKFETAAGKRVLEIGVGLGADHQRFAEAGAELYGIDLTVRAIDHVRRRFDLMGLKSTLGLGDAENLDFRDNFFDVVYAWGVIHHSPDTQRAADEIYRVLKPSGVARVMIYHRWSLVGYMLWVRYALLRARPWRTLTEIYANHLESPGTKAYSVAEAKHMFKAFERVTTETVLTHGDLLESEVGQRHRGWLLSLARRLWPRALLRRLATRHGLFMLITAEKT
jgi:ubiquinone/menaquinone biosynthesis C-methylase UbiE